MKTRNPSKLKSKLERYQPIDYESALRLKAEIEKMTHSIPEGAWVESKESVPIDLFKD